MAEQIKLAVISGDFHQFQYWARNNPEKAGQQIRRGVFEKAFCVTEEFHVMGAYASGVERIGTYYALRNLHQIEQAVEMAVFAGERARG